MNNFKRFLALVLAMCMMLTAAPFNAFAEESSAQTEETTETIAETPESETKAPESETKAPESETQAPESETQAPESETQAPESETQAPESETKAPESENEAVAASYDLAVAAETVGTKPADGDVTGEPFNDDASLCDSTSATHTNYRIPGIVMLNDGTLVASADIRYDYEYDGGGMDLVVSRSTDGNTWNYTFAGYLGDNGNVWNADSSTLMDPVIISDGSTLYLLADMYPAGYSISSSSTANVFSDTAIGFDASGNLLLSDDGRSTYGYYLKDGKIYATDGTETGYTVQGWFDLYQNGTYVTNLFFSDSPFQVRATSYICLTTSTDGGVTWTDPTLVNAKPTGVAWMVLGPGSGLALDGGNIAFTAYDNSNIYLIWGSAANGWNRISTSAATNESSIIELNDGTIRAFVKRAGSNTIAYVDFTKTDSGYTAGNLVDTGVTNFSQCMVSSLHYSKTLNGKEVVLVCCPSKPGAGDWNGRFNGKIHMFTLDSSNNMTLVNSYALNGESDFFAYSNMAEKDDGTIGVLYEDDCISYSAGNYTGKASHITYTSVNLETAFGVTFDKTVTDDATGVTVTAPDLSRIVIEKQTESTPAEGYNRSMTYSIELYDSAGTLYSGSAVVKVPAGDLAGCSRYIGTVGSDSFEVSAPVDGYFTLRVPHFSDVTISGYVLETTTVDITLVKGKTRTVTIDGAAYSDKDVNPYPNDTVATLDKVESSTTAAKKELQAVTAASSFEAGKQYLIVSERSSTDGLLTGTAYNATISWSTLVINGLNTNGTVSADSSAVWTITPVGDGTYYIQYDEKYLTFAYDTTSTASLTDTATPLNLSYSGGYWYITNAEGDYLSNVGGFVHGYYGASGFNEQGGSGWTINEIVGTDETSSTKVTFTAVAVGNTTATIGHVTYNITVVDAPVEGNIADFNNIVGEDTYSDDNSNATNRSDLDMDGKVIKKLTISAGASFNLNVDVTGYDEITWTVDDETIATVDANGNVTAVATGETKVIATVIKNGVEESISIPVVVKPSQVEGASNVVPIFFYIEQVDNTTPYYTMFLSTGDDDVLEAEYTMVPVTEGEVILIERPTDSALGWVWTATPDADHALAYMASTGSVSQYYPLKDSTGALGESTGDISNTNPGAYYKNSISYQNVVSVGEDADEDNWQTVLDAHLATAISDTYKCDGAMSNTRWGGGGTHGVDGVPKMVSSMTFISDPMPTITKTVDGVLPTTRLRADYRRYTEGMVASVGELVYFKISITVDRPTVWVKDSEGNDTTTGAINYTDSIVSDTVLNGAYLYTKELDQADGTYDGEIAEACRVQTTDITEKLKAEWGTDEQTRTIELYLVYQIQEDDIPKFVIDNVANLHTNYQSTYSAGASARDANAEASITVIGSAIHNVVIDFGQSFTYTGLTKDQLKYASVGENVDYKADYGRVTLVGNGTATSNSSCTYYESYTLTYTPTTILQEPDVVRIYGMVPDNDKNNDIVDGTPVRKMINAFIVYPATTVYYEEGFLLPEGWSDLEDVEEVNGWSIDNAKGATVDQTLEKLCDPSEKKHAYGFDPIYDGDNSNTEVEKSYTSSTTKGATMQFNFTGDGFDLYADCTEGSGYVAVMVKNSEGKYVKVFRVNTAVKGGYTAATTGQTGNMDSLPIVSWHGDHDTYTVIIKKEANGSPVTIDGFRVYNTIIGESDDDKIIDSGIFSVDLEDNPDYYQLRDEVLSAIHVTEDTSADYKPLYEQVYEQLGENEVAVILDENDPYPATGDGTSTTVYVTTTTLTTTTTTKYTDGTSMQTVRKDISVQEYTDKNELIKSKESAEMEVTYYGTNGQEIDNAADFAKVSNQIVVGEPEKTSETETVETTMEVTTAQDLLDNGPKNEVYLYPGQTLVFKVQTNRVIQIGLKAPKGATTADVTITAVEKVDEVETAVELDDQGTQKYNISSSVDMFYYLIKEPAGQDANGNDRDMTYTVSVKNNGTTILSVTDLKICDDPNATFVNLTKEDIKNVLDSIEDFIGQLGDLDLDGDVDADDLTVFARYVGGISKLTGEAAKWCDVNGDGAVDSDDLTVLARYIGGIITHWNQE